MGALCSQAALLRASLAVRRLAHRRHDGDQKTGEFRGRVRVGLVRLHGPQHGGAERSHVAASGRVHGGPRRTGRAG